MALDEEADLDLLSNLTDGLSGADLKADLLKQVCLLFVKKEIESQ